jgi:hypothetical protein
MSITNLTNKTVIKSIYFNQKELLESIIKLYCPEGFELDPTYSTGGFYKGIKQPKYKFDILPIKEGVVNADVTALPLKDNCINSIIFDPPFLACTGPSLYTKEKNNIITKRFGRYSSMENLWSMYDMALKEFYRVLYRSGILVFKIQDSVSSGKQYISHYEVLTSALNAGFYVKDIFVLLCKNRILSSKHNNQIHARKFHSYFIVFEKCNKNIPYRSLTNKLS